MKPPEPRNIEKLAKCIDRLRNAVRIRIGDFRQRHDPSVYNQNTHQGIYAITNTDDDVVYIGKTNSGTKEKGVADRIWGHCAKGSDLQSSLGISQTDLEDYYIRTIEIQEPGERGLAELYGIAVYAPKGNRYGYKGISTDLDDRTPAV